VQERGLPGSARAHQRHGLARFNFKGNPAQHFEPRARRLQKRFADIAYDEPVLDFEFAAFDFVTTPS